MAPSEGALRGLKSACTRGAAQQPAEADETRVEVARSRYLTTGNEHALLLGARHGAESGQRTGTRASAGASGTKSEPACAAGPATCHAGPATAAATATATAAGSSTATGSAAAATTRTTDADTHTDANSGTADGNAGAGIHAAQPANRGSETCIHTTGIGGSTDAGVDAVGSANGRTDTRIDAARSGYGSSHSGVDTIRAANGSSNTGTKSIGAEAGTDAGVDSANRDPKTSAEPTAISGPAATVIRPAARLCIGG